MQISQIGQDHYHIQMTPTENSHLMALAVCSERLDITNVTDLIKFHLEYIAESYFLGIKEPETDAS